MVWSGLPTSLFSFLLSPPPFPPPSSASPFLLALPSLPLPLSPFLPHLLLLPSFVTTNWRSAEWHFKNRLLLQSPVPNLGFGCLAQRGGFFPITPPSLQPLSVSCFSSELPVIFVLF